VAQGLTDDTGRVFDRPVEACLPGAEALGDWAALAQSTGRHTACPRTQQELKDLKERFKTTTPAVGPEQLWGAVRDAEGSVRTLNWEKLPADAIGVLSAISLPAL
jgi:hypothetical protein